MESFTTARGLLIDVENGTVTEHTIRNHYKDIDDILRVDLFDISVLSVNGTDYTIYCDDEGLLKAGMRISARSKTCPEIGLVGNLFITRERVAYVNGYPDGYEMDDLTDEDISNIRGEIGMLLNIATGDCWPCLSVD